MLVVKAPGVAPRKGWYALSTICGLKSWFCAPLICSDKKIGGSYVVSLRWRCKEKPRRISFINRQEIEGMNE